MARFYVKTLVEYAREVEAESEAEAEELGFDFSDAIYDGVYSITVEELDEWEVA